MRAKKSFGQHFLNNEAIAQRIADALTLDNGKAKILEVGPGKGMLTKYLLEKGIDLKVVEADRDMVEYLHLNYIQLHGRVISEDFLKLDFENIFPRNGAHMASQFSIIGNFPYNISSQIVFKMLDNRALVPELVGMFQKEMAERIAAPPGNKTYGVISVLTQAFYEGEYLFSVGNHNFTPPPKVQSGVIRLKRKEGGLGCDEKLFKKVVKQAFSQRRKMLRNTLKPFFGDAGILQDDFFKKRPEVLGVGEFVELTNRIVQ
ncbi:MAG TPA: 16S rRNA (adenine(1518)-N(6)/adenine(1519)-N(6))-dimethyltransferase RsmA [Bacteroidetes bacterium]|nr:16S rRNA (adenine(1518)-N(6)/adenine(1519)-N(6))-dimethyltransferase RsmA [Bacteroidota bacterium]